MEAMGNQILANARSLPLKRANPLVVGPRSGHKAQYGRSLSLQLILIVRDLFAIRTHDFQDFTVKAVCVLLQEKY